MALGKNSGNGFGGYTRAFSFGRKRITVSSSNDMDFEVSSTFHTPLKKQRSLDSNSIFDKSALESLPLDVLVKVLCDVDHDDVKQLVRVSKSIKEATDIAKKWHFMYSTPKKIIPFRDSINFNGENDDDEEEEMEAPNAPKQNRIRRSRLDEKKLKDLSVDLFGSPEKEDQWPRKNLLMEMETEI